MADIKLPALPVFHTHGPVALNPEGIRARDIEVARVVLEAAAKVCRNERLMCSDEEWRIRCELADGIEELDFTHD